jgi:vancomycin resistance protein YoaR
VLSSISDDRPARTHPVPSSAFIGVHRRFHIVFLAGLAAFVGVTAVLVAGAGREREVVVAGYSTSLRGRTPNQVANIRRAAAALDGIALAPGQVFSFEKALGPVSGEAGFVKGLAIRDGETAREDGGGICQVSSTLYNAALRAGLRILERRRHLWPVHSVPPGLDAAFAAGHIDLKFQNTLDQPLHLRAEYDGDRLIFRLLGRSPSHETVRVERLVKAVLPPEEVVQATPLLRRGERRIINHGQPGFEVETWRIRVRPHHPPVRERLAADRYAPMHRVIWIGSRRD